MNRGIFMAVFICLLNVVNAQKSEIDNAQKMLDDKQYTQVIKAVQNIENQYDLSTVDPEDVRELFYIKGKSYEEQKDFMNAALAYIEVDQLEGKPLYYVKNKETKQKKYFKNEAQAKTYADEVGGSVKDLQLEPKYGQLISLRLNTQLQSTVNEANRKYQNKEFKDASALFLETYYIAQVLNLESDLYLYYAAISAYQGEDFDTASDLFGEVIEKGYEGNDPENNALENSYTLTAYILTEKENWEEAKNLAEEGLKKFPNNQDLNATLSKIYNKTGDNEAFIKQLEDNIKKDPSDPLNYYNLGILYSRYDSGKETSLDYFILATEKDPAYKDAYQNIAKLIIEKDKGYRASIDQLGSSAADAAKEDEIIANKKNMYSKFVPIFEKAHEQFPDELLYMQLLKQMYVGLGDNSNSKKYEALLRAQ